MILMVKYLTIADVIEANLEAGSDGKFINKGNLEFTLYNVENRKTIVKKAAELLFGIASGHPFVDGNKRTAFITMIIFLRINGKVLKHNAASQLLLERLLYEVANNMISKESLAKVLKELIE